MRGVGRGGWCCEVAAHGRRVGGDVGASRQRRGAGATQRVRRGGCRRRRAALSALRELLAWAGAVRAPLRLDAGDPLRQLCFLLRSVPLLLFLVPPACILCFVRHAFLVYLLLIRLRLDRVVRVSGVLSDSLRVEALLDVCEVLCVSLLQRGDGVHDAALSQHRSVL